MKVRIADSALIARSQHQRQLACAQFGSGIVYDPTQSAHAVQQILRGETALHRRRFRLRRT